MLEEQTSGDDAGQRFARPSVAHLRQMMREELGDVEKKLDQKHAREQEDMKADMAMRGDLAALLQSRGMRADDGDAPPF